MYVFDMKLLAFVGGVRPKVEVLSTGSRTRTLLYHYYSVHAPSLDSDVEINTCPRRSLLSIK
jgi:hypothetical protein